MFLNHSILTMEQDLREIEGKEEEGRRIFFSMDSSGYTRM